MNINKKNFGKNLLDLLNKQNKQQKDLSIDLDIPKATVSSWCRGTRMPRLNKLFLIAEYLEVNDIMILLRDNENIDNIED